jgi:hypothetical protein
MRMSKGACGSRLVGADTGGVIFTDTADLTEAMIKSSEQQCHGRE